MPGPPAAIFKGVCSGHGACIPAKIHGAVKCFTGCAGVKKQCPGTVATMNAYTMWAPAPLAALATPICATIKINKIIPIVSGDQLQLHKSACSVTVIDSACPKAKTAPTKVSCNATVFACSEDLFGAGHPRVAVGTTKTVFFEKKMACRVGDPFAVPCLSKISTGAANVFIGG